MCRHSRNAVVGEGDDVSLVAEAFGLHARDVVTRAVRDRADAMWRLTVALQLIVAAEAANARRFTWVVKVRPDLFSYAALPQLSQLDPRAVHCRVRCSTFADSHGRFQSSAKLRARSTTV